MSEFYFPAFDEFDLDEREQHLCEYFLRLHCIAEKAEAEFDYVAETRLELNILREAITVEFAAMADDLVKNPMAIYAPGALFFIS